MSAVDAGKRHFIVLYTFTHPDQYPDPQPVKIQKELYMYM